MPHKNQLSLKIRRITESFSSNVRSIRLFLLKLWATLTSAPRFIYQLLLKIVRLIILIIDQVLGTVPSLIRADRALRAKVIKIYNDGILDSDPRLQLPVDHLKDYNKWEIERLDRIEDKAKSMVLGIGIAISLATPSVLLPTRTATFVNEPLYFKLALTIGLAFAVSFLLMSGFLSLSAFKVGEVSFPRLEYHPPLYSDDEIRGALILQIDLNVMRVIQKANLLSASMDCLRNGLFLFFIVLIVSLSTAF